MRKSWMAAHMRTLALIFLLFTPTAKAQEDLRQMCGEPPPVANESLKGEIEGKVQVLSRFLGEGDLTGQIQTTRREIFSSYPDA